MKFINRKREQKIEQKNRSYVVYLLMSVLVMIPVALVISTSIQSSHSGAILSDVESEIAQIEHEVRQLESTIVEETSLTDVAKEVEKEGFVMPEQLVYIQKDNPVASLR